MILYICCLFLRLLCFRPLSRPGALAALSSGLQLVSGPLGTPAVCGGAAQEDRGRLSGPVEDCHPPADPAAAHGEGEPATRG